MDGVSVAASIIAIATTGIQVSIKIVTLAGQISTASDRVSSIGNDVSLTSAILHQLGDLMSQKAINDKLTIFSNEGLQTTKASAEICRKVFEEVEKETAKASELIRGRKQRLGEKVKLSILEKAKWPFLQPGLETLRTDLREAKGTLMLMLQVASLALSKRVAETFIPASFSATEQQDIVRSILILQQQQRTHSDSNINARPVEGGQKTNSEASRYAKETNPRRRSGTADAVGVVRGVAVPGSGKKSSQETLGMSTLSRVNSEPPVGSSPDDRASHDQTRKKIPISLNDAKVEELYMCHVCPDVKAGVGTFEITWSWSNIRVSEDEIRERLAKNQAEGLTSVCDILETLDASERSLITQVVNWLEPKDRPRRVTILSLKRTTQDLQQGRIVFKALPSYSLIIQYGGPRETRKQEGFAFGQGRPMDLSRPTYIKVRREHISPETLDIYELPWEWDESNLDYIVIKRWIPEPDQDILFEHTRSLRERQLADNRVELKRERDKLLLVRRKSSDRQRVPSRSSISDEDHPGSGPASDNEHAFPDGRGQAASTLERERKPYSNIPPSESSSATVTLTDEGMSSSEDEHDESANAVPMDEAGGTAAVKELLEKYTTLFEQAA